MIGRFSLEVGDEANESTQGEIVVPSGAAEANALGLTTQVPTREILLTAGPARKLLLAKRTVELRHGSGWQLALGKRPAGKAIHALSWLEREPASSALHIIPAKLPAEEWATLQTARLVLPDWMARTVNEVNARG